MAKQAPAPWDKPNPIPTSGDSSADEIHMAVGAALSRWEAAQTGLMLIFAGIGGLRQDVAIVLYHTQPSSAAKHRMIREAAAALFHSTPQGKEYIINIMDVADKLLGIRNNIAHGICTTAKDNTYLLTGAYHIAKAYNFRDSTTNYAFRSSHIRQYESYFAALILEIGYATDILFHEATPEPYAQTLLSRYILPVKLRPQNAPNQGARTRQPPPSRK